MYGMYELAGIQVPYLNGGPDLLRGLRTSSHVIILPLVILCASTGQNMGSFDWLYAFVWPNGG